MRVSRSLVVTAALGAVAIFGLSSQAFAKCEVTGEIFFLHANDTKKNTARTSQHGCDLHFITRGKTRFTSARIVEKPQNGILRKIANMEFRYKPKPGFTGTDKFALRVCGRTEKGKGCSTLHYDAIVSIN
jgi:hypothetical protein